ncbi:MAG: carboxypeptidase-like regulatory domain-containing protein [Terriglobia bacterium]
MKRTLAGIALLGLWPTLSLADSIGQLNAFQRKGLYHVNIRGSVIDSGGLPNAGARVLIMVESLRGLPLRETTTDQNGVFEFQDVSGSHQLMGVVQPSSEWIPAFFPILGVSGNNVTVDTIHLTRNTIVRATVELVSAKDSHLDPGKISARLKPAQTGVERDVIAELDGGIYTFNHLTFSHCELEVDYYFETEWVLQSSR